MQKHLEFIFVGNVELLMILKGDMIKHEFEKDHLATEERRKRQWGKISFQRCWQHMIHMKGLNNTSLSSLFLLICTMGMLPNKQFLRTYCVCQHCAVCSQAIEGAESSSYWLILANTGSWELILHISFWLQRHLIGSLKSATVGDFYISGTYKHYEPGIFFQRAIY